MKKKILILLMMFMFLPGIIFADSVSISCSKTSLSPGSSTDCKVYGNTNLSKSVDSNYIAGVTGKFTTSGDLEIVSVTKNSEWDQGSIDGNVVDLFATDGFDGKFLIATVKVKVSSSYTSGTLKLLFKATDGGSVEFFDKYGTSRNAGICNAEIKVASSVDTLSSLTVEGFTLSPAFDSTIYTYNLGTTDAASIKISALATDDGATISGTGTKTLAYGNNTFSITCKSEKGTTKTYKISVIRNDTREVNNALSSLTVSEYDLNPTFSSSTLKYTLEVEGDVNTITIGAVTDSTKASFVKNYGPRNVNLNYGENEILIKVKAENEKVKTYTIVVTRLDDRDSNNYLKSLSIEGYDITFDKSTNKYDIEVEDSVTSLKILAEAESLKSTVTISGNAKFVSGINTVTIAVKAENESVRKYVITVSKGEVEEEEDAECENEEAIISNLTVDGKDIGFDELVNEYEIKVDAKTNKLDLKFDLCDGITSLIEGNENLKNGSIVTLTLNSVNEKLVYTFNIVKDVVKPNETTDEKTSGINIYIIIGIVSAVIIIGIVLLLILKKKKNKKEEVTPVAETPVTPIETHVEQTSVEVKPVEVKPVEETYMNLNSTPVVETKSAPVYMNLNSSPVEQTPASVKPVESTYMDLNSSSAEGSTYMNLNQSNQIQDLGNVEPTISNDFEKMDIGL